MSLSTEGVTHVINHLMVPLDGSDLAERALPAAERLAAATGATLHLVRVVDVPQELKAALGPVYLPGTLYEELMTRETEAATAYLGAVRERVTGEAHVMARAKQLAGDTAETLLGYERDAGIDLVVMCSRGRGRGDLTRFVLGSVAERLLRHSPVPILLVRTVGALVTLEHALVPLDGSVRGEEALRVVAALAHAAPRTVAREVTLLRVIETEEQRTEAARYLEEAARGLRAMGFPGGNVCSWRVEQGNPALSIIDAAGTDKLIVMASHGRSGWTRWALLGSVAERVAHYGAAKVLILRKDVVQQTPPP
jgi:nucleotide-binding universal stress UspA family protein